MFACLAMAAMAATPVPLTAEKPLKALPVLAKEPKLDGVLKDLTPALELKMPAQAASASATISAKAAFRKDTLYLGVKVTDDLAQGRDELTVTLYFPSAGTTARGYPYRFGLEGKRPSDPAARVPAFAQELVASATRADGKTTTYEIAVPARALPRWPATRQLGLLLCVDYADFDTDTLTDEATNVSSCPNGETAAGPVRVPDELRKVLKATPPAEVEAIEPRAHGWLGYAELHYPLWVWGDEPLTAQSLPGVVSDEPVDPVKARLPLSETWALPDGRAVLPVVTGSDPYGQSECDASKELRLALYATKANVATRVLEWPAATCGLGRALSFQLSPEGHLTIGYSNGSMANFTFSGDHFERSELGVVWP